MVLESLNQLKENNNYKSVHIITLNNDVITLVYILLMRLIRVEQKNVTLE